MQFIGHDFLLVIDALVLGLLKQFMSGHEKIIVLSPDVEVSVLSNRVENATVRVGEFGLGAVPVFNL